MPDQGQGGFNVLPAAHKIPQAIQGKALVPVRFCLTERLAGCLGKGNRHLGCSDSILQIAGGQVIIRFAYCRLRLVVWSSQILRQAFQGFQICELRLTACHPVQNRFASQGQIPACLPIF